MPTMVSCQNENSLIEPKLSSSTREWIVCLHKVFILLAILLYMHKLKIAGRTNWENRFYIKIHAEEKSIKIIKKIVDEIGDHYFLDNQTIPKSLSKYEKWKDRWIPVITKDIGVDIICGDRLIHMLFYKFPNFKFVNNILDKYCEWSQPKYRKGLNPLHTSS